MGTTVDSGLVGNYCAFLMATPTNYVDLEQQSQQRFFELQRTLILLALKVSYFFDKIFRPASIYQYDAMADAKAVDLNKKLQSLKTLRRLPLVRLAFAVHGLLDSSRNLKELTYTLFLWQWFLFKKLNLNKSKDFELWLKNVEPQEIAKIQARKVNHTYLHINLDSTNLNDLKNRVKQEPSDYVVLQLGAGQLSDYFYKAVDSFLAEHPETEILYGDEDTQTLTGERKDPEFRFSWCIDRFYADDFLSHFCVYKTSFLLKVIGQYINPDEQVKYNLPLLAIEQAPNQNVRHLPSILFHRRSKTIRSEQYRGPEVALRKMALEQHLQRLNLKATVDFSKQGIPRVKYAAPDEWPLVSVVVPIKDKVELLKNLIDDLKYKTNYRNLEIIVVDNNSSEADTLNYLGQLKYVPEVKILKYPHAFNYSAINNLGVSAARGEVLALLNNDLEVIDPNWLGEMVTHSLRPGVGIVGAKLYYKNNFIQHAGVGVGIRPISVHLHRQNHRSESGYWNQLQFTHTVGAVTGACMVLRKGLFEKVGGFDEVNLAVAYNDVDLCLRVRELGLRILWTPYAELYHLESATRPSDALPAQIERYGREIQYMKAKWRRYLENDPCYNPNLTREKFDCEGREL